MEKLKVNFDFDNIEISEFSEESYEQIILATITSVCEDNDVNLISVDIDSYIDDDCLVVNKIEVETDTPIKSDKIENILKNEFGFEVSVN